MISGCWPQPEAWPQPEQLFQENSEPIEESDPNYLESQSHNMVRRALNRPGLKIKGVCCVFQPANWCFACRLLCEIIFFSILKCFSIFFHCKCIKKRKSAKTKEKYIKRGLSAFRCYSKTLVDTQRLVYYREKYSLL